MNKQKHINNSESINLQKIGLKVTNFDLIHAKLTLDEVKLIVSSALMILKHEPTVLSLLTPLKIVGDICGHYQELVKIFEIVGDPANKNYLFLGNYVGKGPNSIECLVTLLYFKVKYPENFFMLGGRFQIPENNLMFGFYEECMEKYGLEIWMNFNELFSYLPLGAVIQTKIYCISSGITSSIKTVEQLKAIARNPQIFQIQEIREILEVKPQQNLQKDSCFQKNQSSFSSETFYKWVDQNNLSLVIRSNEIIEQGFQFSMNNKLLTLCSIPNFLKVENLGAIITINEDLVVSFQILK